MARDRWSPYLAYRCASCKEDAINHLNDSCTKYRECKACHRVPVLDRGQPVDRIAPGLKWAALAAAAAAAGARPPLPRERGHREHDRATGSRNRPQRAKRARNGGSPVARDSGTLAVTDGGNDGA
jgi:DNA-directed RNA polymerase subunit RPC12/RpoP